MKTVLLLLTLLTATFSQDLNKEVDEFSKIKLNVAAETQIVFGDEHRVEIEAPERILKKIEVKVSGRTLIVRDKRRGGFNFFNSNGNRSRDVQIKITTKALTAAEFNASGIAEIDRFETEEFELEINGSTDVDVAGAFEVFDLSVDGSGDVRAESLSSDDINVQINGSGTVRMDGKTNKVKIGINGSGDILAFGLKAESARISINGSGDVKLSVEEMLKARILGSGDITYKGSPEVDETSLGSGDVRKY